MKASNFLKIPNSIIHPGALVKGLPKSQPAQNPSQNKPFTPSTSILCTRKSANNETEKEEAERKRIEKEQQRQIQEIQQQFTALEQMLGKQKKEDQSSQ